MTCLCAVASTPGQPRILQVTPCQTGMAVVYYAEQRQTVIVQASTDAVKWTPVSTNVATGALCAYIDTTTNQCRFYRLKVIR